MVLVNEDVYQMIESMTIDEEKDIFDLYDHNMINVMLSIKNEKKIPMKEIYWYQEYYKDGEIHKLYGEKTN